MTNKIQWKPILEMDLDDGTHTCYSAMDRDGCYVWLTQIADDTWDVEQAYYYGGHIYTIVNCKTLTSAKRYAARYLNF